MTQNTTSFKSVVAVSPQYDAIMADWEQFNEGLSMRAFYEKYVATKDPNIKQETWISYIRRYKKRMKKETQEKQVAEVLPAVKDLEPGDTMEQLEDNSIEYMMKIGTNALQELASDPELARKIPVKDRINMMKDAVKIKNDKESLKLKQKKDEREQSLFEEIMDGAQYGDIDEEEILEGEAEEVEVEEDYPPALPPAIPPQSIQFDPSQV